jgi:hypothetical protein
VIGQCQRYHVGVQTVDHCARLLAGTAMRLLNGNGLSGPLLPLRRERLVDLLLQLTRRIVGDRSTVGVGSGQWPWAQKSTCTRGLPPADGASVGAHWRGSVAAGLMSCGQVHFFRSSVWGGKKRNPMPDSYHIVFNGLCKIVADDPQ